jgi:acetyltransferase
MRPSASVALDPDPLPHHAASTNPLEAFFAPRSVAVIGATENPGSVGRAVMENLLGFSGRVYPVNPKRTTILGRAAFPSIAAVRAPVELAVIVTPATAVPGVIRECAAAGVRSAVIISAGFKETGSPGVELERQVLAEARRVRMRIIGPNCLGVMIPRIGFNATFASALARPGNVAFLSQSGALCTAILDWSFGENVGFSAFVSVGSMLDVGWGDLLYHLADDPHTKSIVCYMESVGDARSFLSAAREVAYTKPIIVIKVGRTKAAAKAAASHTGSLTGSDSVLEAAFRRVGVLRVNTIGELFNMAELLAKQPRPAGPRLTIVTNAGGPGALATDLLVTSGGQLAPLGDATQQALNELLPPHWSHGNPVDVLGDADPARYAKTVEIVSRDPNTDGLLVILTPQAMTDPLGTAEALQPFAHTGRPLLTSWMGGASLDTSRTQLNAAGIPTYDYPDTAARAFALMWHYSASLRQIYETPTTLADQGAGVDLPAAREITDQVCKSKHTLLTEFESKRLLAAYGIPTVETHIARTEDEAVALAEKLGFPVALKLHSETLTHKTDVGGVQLNIRTAAGVRQSWQSIQKSVAEKAGAQHFLGVTVQTMVPREGYELILGSSIDPQFGPVLLFGAGGQLVEVLKDSAIALPPLNATLARRLMEQTKVFTALQGIRGRKPINLDGLAQLLVRFSQLVVENPHIAELDINPLLASSERLVALDARVVLHPAEVPDEKLPRPAIRPYPMQYVSQVKLRDGTALTLRPIRAEDEPLMVKFHAKLSERSVYLRYFTPLPLSERASHQRLARLCFADYDRELALVAEHRDASGVAEIAGIARFIREHGVNEAEFGVIVADAWQGRGLGTVMMEKLVATARAEKLACLRGIILAENHEMLDLARRLGFTLRHVPDSSECEATLTF